MTSLMLLSVSIMTTRQPLSALVIISYFLFASSFIAPCSVYVKLGFSFFVGCFISALISFSTRSIYVLNAWCVSFGVQFSLFLILKGTCSFSWFTVAIQVSSLKWTQSLISQKKFCKSEDSWFLVYLFEVGMKLKFSFRSLYISKENKCFDEFTTFPDASDLYLSVFVIVWCSLKVFALFLVWNSVPLTDWCWFEYGFLRQMPPGCFLAWDVLPYSQFPYSMFKLLLRITFFLVLFQKNNLIP